MKRQRVVSVLATITACLTLSAPSWAALNAYLTLRGEFQGDIKGSVTQKGRAGKIMVIAFDHSIESALSPYNSQPTGQRQHKPLVITKEVDKSSPLLHNAQSRNERLNFELQFWQPSATGVEKQHYTINLVNARIISIHMVMPNNKHPELMRFAEYEEIAFTYDMIVWTWHDGGITAEDYWEAPVPSEAPAQ
jgi:type VI secretion system secreted protein Hcp